MSKANLATAIVQSPPSPTTSGLSLGLATGAGDANGFPSSGRFSVLIHAAGSQPTRANGELAIATRTAASDTITFTARAQGGTTARDVQLGDQITVVATAEDLASEGTFQTNPATTATLTIPGAGIVTFATIGLVADRDYYFPIWVDDWVTFDALYVEVSTASGTPGSTCRLGLYAADKRNQPAAPLIEEFPAVATDTNAIVSSTPAGGSRTIGRGRYVIVANATHNFTARAFRGAPAGGPMMIQTLGSLFPMVGSLYVTRTNAAFQSTPTAWDNPSGSGSGFIYPVLMRVTGNG